MSEKSIKQKVLDQLFWDSRVDSSDIKVEVKDGTVILTGNIPSYIDKGRAETDAWSIEGVKRVDNKLGVKIPEFVEVPTDEKIELHINNLLNLSYNIDESKIDVSVDNGIVTLRGVVDAYWKKLQIKNLISEIAGITDVINEVTIAPTSSLTDEKIAKDVISSLERNYLVNVNEINIKVENGKVKISGVVKNWKAYDAAMDCIKYTAGVVDIDDKLVIESM